MVYAIPYDGDFCTTKPIKRKRTLTPHQKAMLEFYRTHAEKLSDGKIVIHVTENMNGEEE